MDKDVSKLIMKQKNKLLFDREHKKKKAQKGGRSQEAESQSHTKRQYNRCTRVHELAGASF